VIVRAPVATGVTPRREQFMPSLLNALLLLALCGLAYGLPAYRYLRRRGRDAQVAGLVAWVGILVVSSAMCCALRDMGF